MNLVQCKGINLRNEILEKMINFVSAVARF